MQTSSNHSKNKGWQTISQRIKSFFQTAHSISTQGEEIDYYHQYVFPKKIESLQQLRNNSTRTNRPDRRKL